MRAYCLVLIFITIWLYGMADDYGLSDDTDAKYLDELVVEAKRGWIEDGKIVFVPTKKEKQLANSPQTLIESMQLPHLRVDDGSIRTYTGKDVTIFINGHPADAIELATFWPKHAGRVEYMEHPQGGEFSGYNNVVNFVMTDYEIGGVTKLNVEQDWPLNGIYSIASKLVYKKKLTIGLLLNGNYTDQDGEKITGTEISRDLFYDGNHYDAINNVENTASKLKRHGMSGAIMQIYKGRKFSFLHQVSFLWSRNPGTASWGSKVWTPNVFKSDSYSAYNAWSDITPEVKGQYYWPISAKWSLSADWKYKYSRNKVRSTNVTGVTAPIENGTIENVNTFDFKISPTLIASRKFTFNYVLTGTFERYATHYSGTSSDQCVQTRQEIDNRVNLWWNISRSLSLIAAPRLNLTLWQISPVRECRINPSVSFGADWTASDKLRVNGEIQYNQYAANPGELNPVLVQNTELLWTMGNPYLHDTSAWFGYMGVNYLPVNRLSLFMHTTYSHVRGGTLFEYTPMDADHGGLLRTAHNCDPENSVSVTAGANTSFFNRNLTLHAQGSYTYNRVVASAVSMSACYASVSAAYTLGNVRLSVKYNSPMKSMSNNGRQVTRISHKCDASLTYGVRNWYMELSVVDIFNRYSRRRVDYQSQYYTQNREIRIPGRAGSLNITYTFGYGKEVSPGVEATIPTRKTNVISF